MIPDKDIIKMVFALKVRHLRQQKGLSYFLLHEQTGLSTSYLHEIEKGKKYPKVDKINALAKAFDVSYDYLVSMKASKRLQPVIDLLTSDLLKVFPLELFGISTEKLFDLFSNAPDKVNAFVSTIIRLTRNYQFRKGHLYLAALRSYQDMFDNYFEDIEQAVKAFRTKFEVKAKPAYSIPYLENLLLDGYGIQVNRDQLVQEAALKKSRSYYSNKKKILYLNTNLNSAQEKFLIGRELAFQYLAFAERPYLTRISQIDSFETLLTNFKASYFSAALLMDEDELAEDIRAFAQQPNWNAQNLLNLLEKYDVTPEMLLQRMTNILPKHFGFKDIFFLRLSGGENLDEYRMTKELHLSQIHNPYANEGNEHYCRRWVSINIIKHAQALDQLDKQTEPIAEAQISAYWNTTNKYLCLSLAKVDPYADGNGVSVTIGLLINEELRAFFRFLSDPDIPTKTVHTTCERCGIPDCEARAASPKIIQEQLNQQRIIEAISNIEN